MTDTDSGTSAASGSPKLHLFPASNLPGQTSTDNLPVGDGMTNEAVALPGGQLLSMPKSGGQPSTLVAQTNAGYWVKLALDDESLYWTAETATSLEVVKVAKTGGSPSPLFTTATPGLAGAVCEVATDDVNVYWNIPFAPFLGTIIRAPTAGGTAVTIVQDYPISDFVLDPSGVDDITVQPPSTLTRVTPR
jgi:hypothetical protein